MKPKQKKRKRKVLNLLSFVHRMVIYRKNPSKEASYKINT